MMNTDELSKIEELRRILAHPGKVVFLGGAGTSTESGIPDFRSGDGVFAAMRDYGFPPETLLSHTFFLKHTETFFEYYRKFLLHPSAQPNDCHRALVKLEREGVLTAVITQNIADGLLREYTEESGERFLALTEKGLDVSNYVMAQFLF